MRFCSLFQGFQGFCREVPRFLFFCKKKKSRGRRVRIVLWGLGPSITDDRSPVRAPGSQAETKGTTDDILKDIDTMLSAPRWMDANQVEQKNDSDMRREARLDLCHHTRCEENGLARLMYAYSKAPLLKHYYRRQGGRLGLRGVAFMTVLAVLDCTLPSFFACPTKYSAKIRPWRLWRLWRFRRSWRFRSWRLPPLNSTPLFRHPDFPRESKHFWAISSAFLFSVPNTAWTRIKNCQAPKN